MGKLEFTSFSDFAAFVVQYSSLCGRLWDAALFSASQVATLTLLCQRPKNERSLILLPKWYFCNILQIVGDVSAEKFFNESDGDAGQ